MNEEFYQIYKHIRSLLEKLYIKGLDPEFDDFVKFSKWGCEQIDKDEPQYYERWIKEKIYK